MSTMTGSDSVFGHYIQQGNSWDPLLSESCALFRAVVEDNAQQVEAEIGQDASRVNSFFVLLYWGSGPNTEEGAKNDAAQGTTTGQQSGQNQEGSVKPAVTVKQRTLLMIAAFHGSMRVLSLLAVNGADPALVSPDGLTAYELAYAGNHPSTPTIVAYLHDAENSLQVLRGQVDHAGGQVERLPPGGVDLSDPKVRGMWDMQMGRQGAGADLFNPDALPYSTAELTKPEYATDDFRMFCFKVLRCCRRYAHDWRACPFSHPTENARRRDPREVRYCSIACPDYKQGFCIRGDVCPYAHGVFECWLHPSRYRTQLCKDGNKCRRPVCFFAHSLAELRTPSHTWVPTAEDIGNSARQAQARNDENVQMQQSNNPPVAVLPISTSLVTTDGQVSLSPPLQSPLGVTADVPIPQSLSNGDVGNISSSASTSNGPVGSPPQELLSALSGNRSTSSITSQTSGRTSISGVSAPRMSNAFARKHGLNPKDNPIVNLQKIAISGQLSSKKPPPSSPVHMLQPDNPTAMMKPGTRQRRAAKTASRSSLETLGMAMSALSLNGGHNARGSLSESSHSGPIETSFSEDFTMGGGFVGSHGHHSQMLVGSVGSFDSQLGLLGSASVGAMSDNYMNGSGNLGGLQNCMVGQSPEYGNSFVQIPGQRGRLLGQNGMGIGLHPQ